MLDSRFARLRAIVSTLPAVVLVPLLNKPIPDGAHIGREIAGYFQTFALLRSGFGSYYYLTPDESLSGLHLHSALSMPFIKLGYHEGGRLVSLLAAVAAASLIGLVAYRLAGPTTSVLAPALLWIHPWFIDMAFAYEPETLSIALTVLTVYGILRFIDEGGEIWFVLSVAALAIAVTNHLWEATVGLPVVVLLAHAQRYRRVVLFTFIEAVFISAVWYVRGLQTSKSHSGYSIFDVGPLFFSPDWWFSHVNPHPVNIDVTLVMIVGVGAFIGSLWWVYETHERAAVLVAAWFASGLTIPFILPRGFASHQYYIWGLFSPLTLILSIGVTRLINKKDILVKWFTLSDGQQIEKSDRLVNVGQLMTFIVTLAMGAVIIYALVFGYGIGASVVDPVDQATTPTVEQQTGVEQSIFIAAGERLQAYDVAADDIVFVGKWGTGISDDGTRRFGTTSGAAQVLIYGNIDVSARRFGRLGSPRVVASGDPSKCKVQVRLEGNDVRLKKC